MFCVLNEICDYLYSWNLNYSYRFSNKQKRNEENDNKNVYKKIVIFFLLYFIENHSLMKLFTYQFYLYFHYFNVEQSLAMFTFLFFLFSLKSDDFEKTLIFHPIHIPYDMKIVVRFDIKLIDCYYKELSELCFQLCNAKCICDSQLKYHPWFKVCFVFYTYKMKFLQLLSHQNEPQNEW